MIIETMRSLIPLILYGLCCTPLVAEVVSHDLEFQLRSSQTRLTFSASSGGESENWVTYNGTILATISYDTATLRAIDVNFTGGEIIESDESYVFSSNVNYIGEGTFGTVFKLSTESQKIQYLTPGDAKPIHPTTHLINNADHILRVYEGKTTFQIDLLDQFLREITDWASEPGETPITGETTIKITETSSSLLTRTLWFSLITEINDEATIPYDGTSTTLFLKERGRIEGTVKIDVPSEFGTWASRNNVSVQTEHDFNEFGVPYLLLFTFNLPASSTSRDLPIKLSAIPIPHIKVTPPAGGIRTNLIPYSVPYIHLDSWYPVSRVYINPNEESLLKGSTTETIIEFPRAYPHFVRFGISP